MSSLGDMSSLFGNLNAFSGIASSMANMALKTVTIKSTGVEKLQPEVRADAKRIKTKYGPFKIKGTKSKVSEPSVNNRSNLCVGKGLLWHRQLLLP
jgi:hypothetical protein